MFWNEDRTSVRFRLSAGGFLSWTVRGYETYILVVALGPILTGLLSPFAASSLYFYAGMALAATLLGWGVGGVMRGLTVRAIGRRNTATYSVLGYAVLTGATALSRTFLVFIALRFLTGVMLGSEGERGTVFLTGTHPDDRRARDAGSVHAGFGVGILLASVAWFALQSVTPEVFAGVLGPGAWRYLFIIGVLPAVFVLYLRRTAEPERLTDDDDRETIEEPESVTLRGLFGRGPLRRRVVVAVALLFAALTGWWGLAAWVPIYASSIAESAGLANPTQWGAIAGFCYGIGAIAGYVTAEPIADRIGRAGSLLFMLIGSYFSVFVLYLLIRTPYTLLVVAGVVGYFTLGQFGWLHVYLSELFPNTARETALGMAYTVARLVAFVVPVLVGYGISFFEGITTVAASFVVLYGIGILAAMFLPGEMDQPFAEQS